MWIKIAIFLVVTMVSGVLQNIGVRLIRMWPDDKLAEFGGCMLVGLSTLMCIALVFWLFPSPKLRSTE